MLYYRSAIEHAGFDGEQVGMGADGRGLGAFAARVVLKLAAE